MANECEPYRSKDSHVYHIYSDCTQGNNIEVDKKMEGKGRNMLCKTGL